MQTNGFSNLIESIMNLTEDHMTGKTVIVGGKRGVVGKEVSSDGHTENDEVYKVKFEDGTVKDIPARDMEIPGDTKNKKQPSENEAEDAVNEAQYKAGSATGKGTTSADLAPVNQYGNKIIHHNKPEWLKKAQAARKKSTVKEAAKKFSMSSTTMSKGPPGRFLPTDEYGRIKKSDVARPKGKQSRPGGPPVKEAWGAVAKTAGVAAGRGISKFAKTKTGKELGTQAALAGGAYGAGKVGSAIRNRRLKKQQRQQAQQQEAVKLPRQLKNPKKEVLVSDKKGKTITIDRKNLKKYTSKGWGLAEGSLNELDAKTLINYNNKASQQVTRDTKTDFGKVTPKTTKRLRGALKARKKLNKIMPGLRQEDAKPDHTYHVSKIDHDTDGEKVKGLPKSMKVKVPHHSQGDEDQVRQHINKTISNETGYTHHGYEHKRIKESVDMFINPLVAKTESIMNEAKPEYNVKYAAAKRGKIQVAQHMTHDDAKKHLSSLRKDGYNGIISKGGKPLTTEANELDELKKSTLTSYVDNADDSIKKSEYEAGRAGKRYKDADDRMNAAAPNPTRRNVRQLAARAKNTAVQDYRAAQRTTKKRQSGIKKAANRLGEGRMKEDHQCAKEMGKQNLKGVGIGIPAINNKKWGTGGFTNGGSDTAIGNPVGNPDAAKKLKKKITEDMSKYDSYTDWAKAGFPKTDAQKRGDHSGEGKGGVKQGKPIKARLKKAVTANESVEQLDEIPFFGPRIIAAIMPKPRFKKAVPASEGATPAGLLGLGAQLKNLVGHSRGTRRRVSEVKDSMIKIKLNPEKKIGYTVHNVGPGGKKTLDRRKDVPGKKDVNV